MGWFGCVSLAQTDPPGLGMVVWLFWVPRIVFDGEQVRSSSFFYLQFFWAGVWRWEKLQAVSQTSRIVMKKLPVVFGDISVSQSWSQVLDFSPLLQLNLLENCPKRVNFAPIGMKVGKRAVCGPCDSGSTLRWTFLALVAFLVPEKIASWGTTERVIFEVFRIILGEESFE